jgi:Replication-relaxation
MSRFQAQSVGGTDATSMSNRPPTQAHVVRTHIDISLLQLSDRACLRLLEHIRVATAGQLTALIYPSLRTALRRTRKLYLNRLITREPLPAQRGGIPLAYRLSESGRRRLHLNAYRSPGLVTLRHALDGVEFVASLVGYDPGLVQLWLTESHIPHLADGVAPDQLVVIDTGEASALLLVEVDESTERPPVIRERLEAYAKLFEDRLTGWHLLWVVNSPERLARLRQIAGPTKTPTLAGRCWGVAIGDVSELGADAEVVAVRGDLAPRPLRALATDPKARLSRQPVGSNVWIQLLANGGREELIGSWHGVNRGGQGISESGAEVKAAATAVEIPAVRQPTPSERRLPPADDPNAGPDLIDSRKLTRLILDSGAEHSRRRAVEILAGRGDWYQLFVAVETMLRTGEPKRQIEALTLVRGVCDSASEWFRGQWTDRLRYLISGSTSEPSVVEAALAFLAETSR